MRPRAAAMAALVALPLCGVAPAASQAAGAPQASSPGADATTFGVIGHARGDRSRLPNPRLDEVLAELREVDPAFLVLTGDNIWGDNDARAGESDPEWLLEQWVALDSVLARLDVPVHRVPGNHDIRDSVTYRVYTERYGELPRAVDIGRTRLLLLTTAWDPARPDRRRAVRGFGYHLDSGQIEFLRESLAETAAYDQAFVFMHHVLWWEGEDSPWWTEAHPILAEAGVEAVFTGDYGPAKFSHATRDGVDYFQAALAGDPGLAIRRGHEWNRLLARQFDSYLVVRAADGEADYDVGTVGEVSSGHFTHDLWWDVHGSILRPGRPGGREHLAALWAIPRARLVLLGALGGTLVAGFALGWWLRRRRA